MFFMLFTVFGSQKKTLIWIELCERTCVNKGIKKYADKSTYE